MMKSPVSARRYTTWSAVLTAAFLFLASTASAQVFVKGKVVNGTTGQPASGVMLTLITFVGGMSPVEEVVSATDGTFAFEKALSASSGQPMLGMVRAEYEGVPYSTYVRSETAGDMQVDVYSVDEQPPTPDNHIVILEPGESEIVVNETFMFLNNTTPPRAFRNVKRGTLRFYVQAAAKGVVQVRTEGPQRMSLKSVAEPAGEEDIYKIDFAIKPGENRIDITYMLPHSDGDGFSGRVLYDGLPTRIAAPRGVTLEGGDITSLGPEPHTQAELFDTPTAREYEIGAIRGAGQLRPPEQEASESAGGGEGGGGGGVRVAPAPITEELYWLLGLTGGIFAVGFVYLYTSRSELSQAPVSAKATSPGKSRRARRKS